MYLSPGAHSCPGRWSHLSDEQRMGFTMTTLRKTIATLGTTALLATPLSMIASPAHADGPEKDREFRVSGAEVDFSAEKDDGRFEVEVDINDADPGSTWSVVLWHDGKRFHKQGAPRRRGTVTSRSTRAAATQGARTPSRCG